MCDREDDMGWTPDDSAEPSPPVESPTNDEPVRDTESFFPKELAESMDAMMNRWEIRRALRNQEILDSKKNWISDQAFLCWKQGDLQFFLVESGLYKEVQEMKKNPDLATAFELLSKHGRYNGYVRFPKLPLVAPGFDGIARYVPVHGGITFYQDWWDGSCTYGFDTGHAWSGEITEIINDIGWMMKETEAMARGIQIAARFEPYYLNARTNERKAVVLERMQRFIPVHVGENLGVMLKLLTGEL